MIYIIALQEVNTAYEGKVKEGKHGKEIFGLAWDVEELSSLNESGRQIIVQCNSLKERLLDCNFDRIASNFASQMETFRQSISSFVRRVTRYRRVAATHILVVLISPEERKVKPYALTVQCIAYKSIKDNEIRKICDDVVKEMTVRGMKVAGEYDTIIMVYDQ